MGIEIDWRVYPMMRDNTTRVHPASRPAEEQPYRDAQARHRRESTPPYSGDGLFKVGRVLDVRA